MNYSPQGSCSGSQRDRWAFCLLALILGLGFVVFIQVGDFDFVELDDPPLVVDNPYVNQGLTFDAVRWAFTFREKEGQRTAEGVRNVWAPLAFLSHALDVELWGMNPAAHHLTNAGLHLVTTALVFFLFWKITGRAFGSAVISAVFCFHPLRVESVAWISERKDVLSGFFSVACLVLYWRWARHYADSCLRRSVQSKLLFGSVMLLFLGSCLAKPTAVVLPALMVLMDVWPLKRAPAGREWKLPRIKEFLYVQIQEKWPILLISVVLSALSVYFQYKGSHARSMDSLGLPQRIMEMPALVLYYIERTVIPIDLFPSYPRYLHAFGIYSLLAVAILIGLTVYAWLRRHSQPAILFGWVWFFAVLSPVLGLFYVGPSFSSDRYTYLAHCGLAIAVVEFVACMGDKNRRWRIATVAIGILTTVSMAGRSWFQARIWRSTGALYQYGVEAQPLSSVAWNNLGAHRLNQGNPEDALACLQTALELGGGHDVHFNLGLAARRSGAPAAVQIRSFRDSLALAPNFLPALIELGLALVDPSSRDAYAPQEGRRHLERACDVMEYAPSATLAHIVNKLLASAEKDGDHEQYLRVLSRAQRSGLVVRQPASSEF